MRLDTNLIIKGIFWKSLEAQEDAQDIGLWNEFRDQVRITSH